MTANKIRVAVIADTHNQLPRTLLRAVADADEIWHLGDVIGAHILDELRTLGRPLKIVRGNCDPCNEWPLALDFSLAGLKIRLTHIPPAQAPPGVDLLLHGHTHVPRDERIGATRFLNPGCIGRPNRGAPPSYAWLTIEEGEPVMWKIHPLV
jgi:putative phosphoesterase